MGLLNSHAQGTISESEFEVEGVCNMCKKRIENAAYISGVKMVSWDKQTHMLRVAYKSSKVSLEEIHKALSDAGHRTSEMAADNEAYSELPHCCMYDDGIEDH